MIVVLAPLVLLFLGAPLPSLIFGGCDGLPPRREDGRSQSPDWRAALGDDRGAVETSQIFAWIAVVVVAIIGVSAALRRSISM